MADRKEKSPIQTAEQENTVEPDSQVKSPAAKEAGQKKIDLISQDYYLNRELSWLDFNARVLETALDERLPLLEQT